MRNALIVLFSGILLAMIAVTALASLERSLFEAGRELLRDGWFRATLCDAYFGFLTFYVWVAYKERSAWGRTFWFALIVFLGNIAMAVYMLIQLVRLPRGAPLSALLLRGGFHVRRATAA